MWWKKKTVLVTGGASFIGSHLVDHLLEKDAPVIRVVDDLSSGQKAHLRDHIHAGRVEFHQADLFDPDVCQQMVQGIDIVFHLAAIHGGRGYVDLHQADCARNMVLDGLLIKAAQDARVQKFVFASSGCVYPNYLQHDVEQEHYLTEDMVGPPFDADNLYGWAKLMTEMTLRSYYQEYGLRSVSCRFFTVYGERGVENHAVIAMIARALLKQNPFEVWGDGTQIRNWTYVGDIVRGMVLAAEVIENGTAINLGTEERTRVIDAAQEILRYTGHQADIRLRPDMPTGPLNRVASNQRAKRILGWEPQMMFHEGLHRTIDWYFATKQHEVVSGLLPRLLTDR